VATRADIGRRDERGGGNVVTRVTGGGRSDKRRGADDAKRRCGYRLVASYYADGRREIPAADTTVADVPSDRQ
jgi:hypothetical protein